MKIKYIEHDLGGPIEAEWYVPDTLWYRIKNLYKYILSRF